MIPVLSVRLPWAWLIVKGIKPVENRTWPSRHRGPLFIHASSTFTRGDYEACSVFCSTLPGWATEGIRKERWTDQVFFRPMRGSVLGIVNMTGCVEESKSPWFVGRYGFEMADAKIVPLVALKCPTPQIFMPTVENVGASAFRELSALANLHFPGAAR